MSQKIYLLFKIASLLKNVLEILSEARKMSAWNGDRLELNTAYLK